MICVFLHKLVILKYGLNELTYKRNIYSLLEFSLFSWQFYVHLIVNNYKSEYQNTIWSIMQCIMNTL